MGTEESVDRPNVPDPPPPQPGPHFAIVDGLLDVVRHPSSGLNLSRLEKLVPALREAVAEARELLGRSNSHARLARRLALYDALLAGEISDLDYELVATFGIQLANAETAAQREIEDRIQPALEDDAQAALADVLNLNALVVLSTDVGQQILDDAAKWDRTVAQQQAFKEAAIEIAEGIERSGIATAVATDLISQSSADIGTGAQPERSSVSGQRVIMSAGVALVAGAVAVTAPLVVGSLGWIATVVVSDGIKKSVIGQVLSKAVSDTIDDPLRLARLGDVRGVVKKLAPKFRTVAGDRREFRWVHEWLDFIEGVGVSRALSREEKILAWIEPHFPNSLVLQEEGVFDYLITDHSGDVQSGVAFVGSRQLERPGAFRKFARAIARGEVPTAIICVELPNALADPFRPPRERNSGTSHPIDVFTGYFSSTSFEKLEHFNFWANGKPFEAWRIIEVGPVYEDADMRTRYLAIEGLLVEKTDGSGLWDLVAARPGRYASGEIIELIFAEAGPPIGTLFFESSSTSVTYEADGNNQILLG